MISIQNKPDSGARSTPEANNNPVLPADSYRWNRAIRGAFKKGVLAFRAGQPIVSCPYTDKRKIDGRLSWSRSFISAWVDGWKWAANGKDRCEFECRDPRDAKKQRP